MNITLYFLRLSVVVEPSYTVFESIGFGRMSFNGFNPQVEVYCLFIMCSVFLVS